jgi:ABC-2 type transport system permease protein
MTEFFSDTAHLLVRHIRYTLRQPIWVVVILVQPIIWLGLFGQLFRKIVDLPGFGTGSYIQFLTPGVLIMSALFSSLWAGMGLLDDLDRGVVDRLLATPMHRGALVTARVLNTVLTVVVQSIIILLIGLMLGASFPGGIGGVAAVLLAAVLLSSAAAAISNGLALVIRREETLIAMFNFFGMPLTFLSTAFIAVALMPPWMQAVARGNPVNWAILAGRDAVLGQDWSAVWGNAGLLAAAVLVAAILAVGAFRLYRQSV